MPSASKAMKGAQAHDGARDKRLQAVAAYGMCRPKYEGKGLPDKATIAFASEGL